MLKAKETLHTSLIPICCNGKKIRDNNGNWRIDDAYLTQNFDGRFTHGICAECVKRLYPTLNPQKL
jgi:hypothetical protein